MNQLTDFFLPKKPHFGLSISRTSLRGVEVDKKGKVTAAVEVPIPDGVLVSGVIVKKDVFVACLKKLLQTNKFTTKQVAVCFSEVYAYTREYQLPLIDTEEVNEAVSWHVKELIPYPPEEIYYDWRLLGTSEKEHRIAVVAVQRKIIDSLLEALVNCGLKPLRFEPGTSAITRLLALEPGQQALITEVNRVGAYVTLVESNKALFTTVVNYSPEDKPETYFNRISQAINEVVSYYKYKEILKEKSVYVLLTGELASNDWAKALAAKSPYQVKILKTDIISPAYNKAYSAAVAKVSALRDENSINLLPEHMLQHYEDILNTQFYQSLFGRLSFIAGFLCILALGVFVAIVIERQSMQAQVVQLAQTTKHQGAQMQDLLLLNAHAKNIVNLSPLRVTPQQQLLALSSVIPEGITVKQWEYDDKQVQYILTGISSNRNQLLLFKDQLEQVGEFTKITLPLGSLESPENVKFTISFVVK